MHTLSAWFIRNPVAANLMMLLIVVAGWLTVSGIRIEGFPKLPADALEIATIYPNAHVTQVDQQVTRKIEKSLEGLSGIKKVTSFSSKGLSSITVQRTEGYSLERLSNDIRAKIDAIYGLPSGAERPIITRNNFDLAALIVQLYGETDQQTLQTLAKQVRASLLALPEISKLKTWGLRDPEIRIEINKHKLRAFGLTSEDIVRAMQAAAYDDISGELETQSGKIEIRTDRKPDNKQDLEMIPLLRNVSGQEIYLKDVARIVDDFTQEDSRVRFNGQTGIGMEVLIGRDENLLDIAKAVKESLKDIRKDLPQGVQLVSWADSSHYISERLTLLQDNAIQGLILVFVLLALFLNIKLAFWVAMGIPIAIAGALAVMGSEFVGYSLNDVTTFGLIIALGILVDDAVVVGESVHEERSKTDDRIIGTERGVKKIATATIYGVLTTIAAFFPMLLIDNAMGKILASFSGVVILTLIFSLIESKLILPAHLASIRFGKDAKHEKSTHKRSLFNWLKKMGGRIQKFAQSLLNKLKVQIYLPILKFSLRHRYAVFISFLSVATLGLGLMANGAIRTVFFPDIPGQYVNVQVEMDPQVPISLTHRNAQIIEDSIKQLNIQWQEDHQVDRAPVTHILNVVNDASSIEIYAELSAPEHRPNLGAKAITQQWQAQAGKLEGTTETVFSASEETGGGFALQVYGKNEYELHASSQEIIEFLASYDGVSNLRQSLKPGQAVAKVRLKESARNKGFNDRLLASQIGDRFGGSEAYRIQRGSNEIKVIVKNSLDSRDNFNDLRQHQIRNNQGVWFNVSDVAHITSQYQTSYLERRNGQQVNTIQATLDKNLISPSELGQALFNEVAADIEARYPSITIREAGELEEIFAIKGNLIKALLFTCLLIYVLLAIPLKSYVQPFIIMSVVPFGFFGAALGHLFMDVPLSLLSFFGMLALAGVVVNDSLVMLSRFNQARERGLSLDASLIDSGLGRFKAIFLTTTTTVAGLTPLILETSEQAQYLIPAAISLAFGEIFATAITLILIPVLLAILSDLKGVFVEDKLGMTITDQIKE